MTRRANAHVLLLCLAFVTSPRVIAADPPDTPANRAAQADRYFNAVPPQELMDNLAREIVAHAPPDQRKSLRLIFNKHFDRQRMIRVMRDSLVEAFTAGELQALADFYSSPHGKAVMQKLPAYTAKAMTTLMPDIQRAIEESMAELNAKTPSRK